MADWTAIVLTGGASRRLGRDKATAVVAGRRMIDRVLDAIPHDVPVVVVGPDPGVDRSVVVTREDPPGGGPAAALAAGLRLVTTDTVAVLAADMPFGPQVVRDLLPQLRADAVVAQADGHPQPLCAVYSTAALRSLRIGPGTSMRAVLDRLTADFVDCDASLVVDIDTPADLDRTAGLLTIMDRGRGGLAMQDWVDAVRQALGLEMTVDVDLVLDVAKDAAHGVARPAAPVTTFLLGAAVAGGADPRSAAQTIAGLAQGWQPDADA